jgi:parallel beta-helix repeat protein
MKKHKVRLLAVLWVLVLVLLLAGLSAASLSPKELRVPQDYPSIQGAIEAAEPGDTILIGAGTYQENLVIAKSLSLKGEGKYLVTLQAADPQRPSILIRDDANVALTGFTITGGSKGLRIVGSSSLTANEIAVEGNGEGIYLGPFAQLELASSEVSGNQGDGLVLLGQAQVHDSEISGNGHQGLKVWSSGSVSVRDNKISGNGGEGLFLGLGSIEVLRNMISDNGGEGIEVWGFAQATIQGNRISNNRDGILVWGEAQATISNNTISKNRRDGALLVDKARAELTGNEITRSGGWGIAVWVPTCHADAQGWTFLGAATGAENRLKENGLGDLCGVPEGLKKQE